MRYVSTRGEAPAASFAECLMNGLAPDGGLYVPAVWPEIDAATIARFAGRAYPDIAGLILSLFAGDDLDGVAASALCHAAYAGFSHPAVAPLSQLAPGVFLLELFHGPSLAFKDIAMQLLARLYARRLGETGERRTIVCATSGDTGGAAVAAFRGLAGVRLVVLFPEGRISEVQRRFITTADDDNVRAVAVEGDFDDCQRTLKSLFADPRFARAVGLTAVNSINFARIVAQTVYYFAAASALGAGLGPKRRIAFAVPSGNFGDAFAGWAARRMGLDIETILVATNANDGLAKAFCKGRYARAPMVATSSPAMDIQVASNFERLYFEACDRDAAATRRAFQLFDQVGAVDLPPPVRARLAEGFSAGAASDAEAARAISVTYESSGVLIDPHTAVALAVAERWRRRDTRTPLVVLATAHPAKFPDTVKAAAGARSALPRAAAARIAGPERFDRLPRDEFAIKAYVRAFAS